MDTMQQAVNETRPAGLLSRKRIVLRPLTDGQHTAIITGFEDKYATNGVPYVSISFKMDDEVISRDRAFFNSEKANIFDIAVAGIARQLDLGGIEQAEVLDTAMTNQLSIKVWVEHRPSAEDPNRTYENWYFTEPVINRPAAANTTEEVEF
jgi:hypothetical protein